MDIAFTHAIARLSADNRSGAADIAERAADILLRRATIGEAASPSAFRDELLRTGWALIQAQPTMAPIVNLVNAVLWKLEECEEPQALRQAVADATDHFKRQMRHNALQVAESALALINEGSIIVTCSQSTTVQHALLHAQRTGRHFAVICAESRPAYEGRETAAQLTAYGIQSTLMVDMAAVESVADASIVIVGADLLSSTGLVNKVGTQSLALAAKASNVPMYTLCSSEKFLPLGYTMPDQKDWPAEDIWPEIPEGVSVRNVYYDFTPLHEITGVVTEQGVLPAATIEAWLASTKLHPALASRTFETVEM